MGCQNPGVQHKCTCGAHSYKTYEVRVFDNESISTLSFVEKGDRLVEGINENDWRIIIDDEAQTLEPKKIIQIPSGMPYTLLKGNSTLDLKITK